MLHELSRPCEPRSLGYDLLCTGLTFRKCVDVCVTFKNDPNNHSFDIEKLERIIFLLAFSGHLMLSISPRETIKKLLVKKLILTKLLVKKLILRKLILKNSIMKKLIVKVKMLPVIGLVQAVQRLEKSSAKHSAQYGRSSLEVNLWPAKVLVQLVQVKHSRW